MKKSKLLLIALSFAVFLFTAVGCRNEQRESDYNLLKSIMSELSQKQAIHVLQKKEHIINGVSDRASDDEIWRNRDNWAQTIHMTDSEQSNTLFYDGVFYIQHESDGAYIKSDEIVDAPVLWPGVLNTVSFEDISASLFQDTADGSVLTVTFMSNEEDETEITAIITMDAHGNVISITTKSAWNVVANGQSQAVEAIYTTLFLSFEEKEIDRVIEERRNSLSGYDTAPER